MTSISSSLAAARTLLFVPANRPERFEKAIRSGADAVILDFEDSVSADAKIAARQAVADAWPRLQASGVPLVVRINAPETPTGQEDIRMLAGLQSLAGVMVPKTESADSLQALGSRSLSGIGLLPLIETAAGHAALDAIAGAAGVVRLVVGHIDFMADTGLQCSDDEPELAPLRFAVAMATRLHGLAPAIDGVTVEVNDEQRLLADTRRTLRFGFSGKLCIHPKQVAAVHEALAPSPEALVWAHRVVEADAASGGSAIQLDGRMIDAPVVLQARRTLARAARQPQA